MKPAAVMRVVIVLLLLASLGLSTGCLAFLDPAVSFTAGWDLGALSFSGHAQTACYQNGVQVDCATLPTSLTGS